MTEPREKDVPFATMAFKVVVFSLPNLVLTEGIHSKSRLLIASSWVAGALLQALVPPAGRGLLPILATTLVVGVAYIMFGS